MLITPEYKALNAELHAKDNEWGRTHLFMANLALQVFHAYNCHDLLDYGCGKGNMLGMGPGPSRTYLYDPCVPGLDRRPKPADMVMCTAVLEHVEPECLNGVLDDLEALTKRIVVLSITTVPSSKYLADGRNAHLVIQPIEWWLPQLISRWTPKAMENMGECFWFIGKKRIG